MSVSSRVLPVAFALLSAVARGQAGAHDQHSPVASAGYNGDATSLVWQVQVRAGLTGQLEGFTLQLSGAQGATLQTTVRVGGGWNTTPAVFQATITKPTAGTDNVFVDVTSASIHVVPGTLFVIELQGTGTGAGINGSYVDPMLGPPLYPEPLFLGGPGCFADCGWRIGFDTYVRTGSAATYCFGDGTGGACPCGNSGAAGNGCASSVNAAGAQLGGIGSFSLANDSAVLTGSGMPNATCLYFQGTTQTNGGNGAAFGDGLRCASGTIIRLGTKTNSSGASQYPGPLDAAISVRGLVAVPGARTYQVWYRNAASFCTAATFNLSNGVQINWQP